MVKLLFTSILIIQYEYALCMMVNLNLSIPMVWPVLCLLPWALFRILMNFPSIFTHQKQGMNVLFLLQVFSFKPFCGFSFNPHAIILVNILFNWIHHKKVFSMFLVFVFFMLFHIFHNFTISHFSNIVKFMFSQASNKF